MAQLNPAGIAQQIRQLYERVLASRVLKDSAFIFAANTLSTALTLLTSIILAQQLGPSNYGLIILVISIVKTVVGFIDIRGAEGMVKFMTGEVTTNQPSRAMAFLHIGILSDVVLGAAAFAAVWLFIPYLTTPYPDSETLKHLISLYMLTIPINFIEKSLATLLTTFRHFLVQAILRVVEAVVSLVCLVLLVGKGPQAIMVGYVIASAVGSLITFVAAAVIIRRNFTSLRGSGYRSAMREFLPMAFHLNILATIKVIGVNIDTLVIGALASTSQVGFYSIASGATSLLSLPIAPVSHVIFPELSEASARKDIKRVKYLINRFMLVSAVISVMLASALAVTANWLVLFLYGPEYSPVVPIIWVLLIGIICALVFGWTRAATVAAGKPHLNLFPLALTTGARIIILIGLVSQFGAVGAAIAYDIGFVLLIVANYVLVLPQLGWWTRSEPTDRS